PSRRCARCYRAADCAAMGVSQWVEIEFSRPGKPTEKQPHQDVQWPPEGGMFERFLVLVAGRRPRPHRGMEKKLQRGPVVHGPYQLDAKGFHPTGFTGAKSYIGNGPDSGAVRSPQ